MRVLVTLFFFFSVASFAYNEPFAYDPFAQAQALMVKQNVENNASKKVVKEVINLSAIMSDKAFINGRWYGLGEKFGSYRVNIIRSSLVGLERKGKLKIISLGTKKHVLTIKEKE